MGSQGDRGASGAAQAPGGSRRSDDRAAGAAPLHLVSAFATTARLVVAAEAVPDKGSELAAIPVLLERLGAEGGLNGALVSIDGEAWRATGSSAAPNATNATIAQAITDQGADYLLAVKGEGRAATGSRRGPNADPAQRARSRLRRGASP